MWLFRKKPKTIRCKVFCYEADVLYREENDKTVRYYEGAFKIVDPIDLNWKNFILVSDDFRYLKEKYYDATYDKNSGELSINEENE